MDTLEQAGAQSSRQINGNAGRYRHTDRGMQAGSQDTSSWVSQLTLTAIMGPLVAQGVHPS